MVAVVALTACTETASAQADVTGNWSGTYADSTVSASGALTAGLTDTAGTLGGTLTISSGWACSIANQGTVKGTTSGDSVSATVDFGLLTSLSLAGTVSGNTMSGSFDITSGVCSGQMGTFTLSR